MYTLYVSDCLGDLCVYREMCDNMPDGIGHWSVMSLCDS